MENSRRLACHLTVMLAACSLACCIHVCPAAAEDGPSSGGDAAPAGREAVDHGRAGSIDVTLLARMTNTPVANANLEIYRVATIYTTGEGDFYELTGPFADSGVSLEQIGSSNDGDRELAERLANYARQAGAEASTVTTNGDGSVHYATPELGVYLIAQQSATKGYEPLAPFVVTVPHWDGAVLNYDVDAAPKVGTLEDAPATVVPVVPSGGSNTQTNANPDPEPTEPTKDPEPEKVPEIPVNNTNTPTDSNPPESSAPPASNTPAPQSSTPGTSLARTGDETRSALPYAAAGVALVAGGGVLLRMRSRRRQ